MTMRASAPLVLTTIALLPSIVYAQQTPTVAAICGPVLERTGREYASFYDDTRTFSSVYSQTCRSSEQQMGLSWQSVSQRLGVTNMTRDQWCATYQQQFESARQFKET